MTHAQMIQTQITTSNDRMYMAFELSNKTWKILFSNGIKRRKKSIDAGDACALHEAINRSKKKLKISEPSTICSCYEAGRDGF